MSLAMIFGRRVLAAAVVVPVLALSACRDEPAATAGSDVAASDVAAPGKRVGPAGSACELPVQFDTAKDWRAEAVTVDVNDPLAALTRRGPATMACEIDAKPGGNLGFLRVWTADGADARQVLAEFVGEKALRPSYTDTRIGGTSAVEVTYETQSEISDGPEKEVAFALAAGDGLVIVSMDSFDNEEYAEMLPAYELAKSTLVL